MNNELVKYDAACRAVSEARTLDEAKTIRDQAEAMRAYARQAKNKQLEVDAAEIRMRAERRLGEILSAAKEAGQLRTGRPKNEPDDGLLNNRPDDGLFRVVLDDIGVDRHLSTRAQKLAAVPTERFEVMVSDWRERVQEENERVTTNLLREGERAIRDAEMPCIELPAGKYSVIYADPPWRYEFVESESRAIENQYPTLSIEDICALDVAGIANDDAILFMWATSPKLAEAMSVVSAWGFVYRSSAVWVKPQLGMGYYFRQQHELLLVATRGSIGAPAPENRQRSVYEAPRQKHSAKPEAFYGFIEAMYPDLPRVELFQRVPRATWRGWGNEVAA
jgi:N6-adenosine-specific RNA methylase IME4